MNKYLPYLLCCLAFSLIACSSTRSINKRSGHSSTNSKANYVVQEAQRQIGSKYKYGGSSPSGFDCSGLVYYVYDKANYQLPRVSSQQAKVGKKIGLKELKAGDLIFFGKGKVDHVGIVQKANNKQLHMIHSSSSKGVVKQEVYSSSYWNKRVLFGRRIIN